MEFPMRINKYLAHEGYATRRGADALIEAGKVLVNGVPAVIGQKIEASDAVEVVEKKKKQYSYLLYYKPRGIITHSPAENETDIETHIKETHNLSDVFPIGRLDKDSEGLMILTNDGRITERILNPEKAHEREYHVSVDKKVIGDFLKKLEAGVNIEGYVTKDAKAEKDPKDEHSFFITLTEGKKHQVRRMCAALGYQVTKLMRTRILTFSIGDLESGDQRPLSKNETKQLYELLGLKS